MSAPRFAKGYTMVEAVVAMVMISIAVLGAVGYYSNANEIQKLAMHKHLAAEIAEAKLEQIKNSGYAALPNPATNNVVENANINTGTPPVYSAHFGNQTVTRKVTVNDNIVSGITESKQVDVKVSWTEVETNAAKSVQLSTLFSP